MTLRKIVGCSGILNQCLHGINRGLVWVLSNQKTIQAFNL